MKPAILTDLTKCIGCKACVLACKETNELPADGPDDRLSAGAWTAVEDHGDIHVRRQCMHCIDPACASVCPVGALHKTPEGPVVYDARKCIGCRYCMIGCPFNIPKYQWDSPLPTVKKCVMCYEKRLQEGRQPACTAACPTGATIFGDRDELVREARRRIAAAPERYVDHIYGLEEAGGTSVLYLSSVPFETLGFRTTGLMGESYPRLTWEILSKIPNVVSVAGVMLVGIWWLTGRKDVVAKVESGEMSLDEAFERMPPLTKIPGREDGGNPGDQKPN